MFIVLILVTMVFYQLSKDYVENYGKHEHGTDEKRSEAEAEKAKDFNLLLVK